MKWKKEEAELLISMFESGFSNEEIAKKLNTTEKSIDSKLYKLKKAKKIGERGEREVEESTYKEEDAAIHIVCSSKRIVTREDIIEHFNIDTDVWKIDSFEVKTSEGYRKDKSVEWDVSDGSVTHGKVMDSGKMLIVPLTHTKTKFIRRIGDDIRFDEIDKYFEKKDGTQSAIKVSKGKLGGRRLEICLADLHIGSRDFDVTERAKAVIEDILLETKHLDIELIYLVPLGDTLHYDTMNKTTSKGTIIDYGLNPFDMFDAGGDTMIWIIDRLSQVAPVDVIGIYGNHDRALSYALFRGLSWYYRNTKGITVDTKKEMHKVREFGNCLFLCHHADMNKKRFENLIFNEAREQFGRTLYAEIHGAHEHNINTKDLGNGVIVRINPTIAAQSEWEVLMGFAGLRSSVAYVWDAEKGIKNIISTNL